MDWLVLRRQMVEEQIGCRGINDPIVLGAFLKIERHRFVPEESVNRAYADFPLPIGHGQTISQPYIVALMTQCLGLSGREKVLEIGTGSGYQSAILAQLCRHLYTIERIKPLAERAEALFSELSYSNIKLKVGDGSLGWPEEAPFERIIVTAASPQIPEPLADQLAESGKMVLPLGDSFSQVLTVVSKSGGKLGSSAVCGCVFVPLLGEYGWRQ
jgi:protein-L-isoaspartate(D-aspartate) O-methyltransferase